MSRFLFAGGRGHRYLYNNEITSISDGAFTGLAALAYLYVDAGSFLARWWCLRVRRGWSPALVAVSGRGWGVRYGRLYRVGGSEGGGFCRAPCYSNTETRFVLPARVLR